jgi:hypothetical protein
MKVFGTSAIAALALQGVLFGVFLTVLWLVLKRLQTPAWCVNLAGCLLFAIGWRERPDGLAHCFGMMAIYSCVRSFRILDQTAYKNPKLWCWVMAVCGVLAFCVSMAIGGLYVALLLAMCLAAWYAGRVRPAILPLFLMVAMPVGLIFLAKKMFPEFWAGYGEYARQMSSLREIHAPHWQDAVRIIEQVPGVMLVLILLPAVLIRRRANFSSYHGKRYWLLLVPSLAAGASLVAVCLLTGNLNALEAASYLQCPVVASYFAFCGSFPIEGNWLRRQARMFLPAIALGAVTMLGMSTWGVVCALDVSRAEAVQMVDLELGGSHPKGYKVVMSPAFLYDSAKHDDIEMIHSDCLAPFVNGAHTGDLEALIALKPAKLILTQQDYYLRYGEVIEELKQRPEAGGINFVNKAIKRTPDSVQYIQKVVRNVSWAPVVVDISWKTEP